MKIQEEVMPTQYVIDVTKIIDLLDRVSARGYESQPVKSRYSERMEQRCVFLEEEMREVRSFQGKYGKVLRRVDYPISDMFGSEPTRTASLLSMLTYMLDETSPDYVAENTKRLEDALVSHKDQFEALELNRML